MAKSNNSGAGNLLSQRNLIMSLQDIKKADTICEPLGDYMKDKWEKDIYEELRVGYGEMSQINLNLAEMGLEQDILDLNIYEARLIGCEKR